MLNILNFLKNEELYINILERFIKTIIIVILAYITIKISLKILDYVMKTSIKANSKLGIESNEKRNATIHKLIKSTVTYTIYFIATIQILSTFGVNTAGILASAGLVSVAVGFGAQSLVKDIITGFFIILEGQFDVGDYVKINNQSAFIAEGKILALGLRSTKILSNGGEVYFVPNSSINQVINYSQNYNLLSIVSNITISTTLNDIESSLNKFLEILNSNNEYKKYFYKKEKLKLNSLIGVDENVASFEIIVKATLGKKNVLENMLKKDLYLEFTENIVSIK
ncbi:mechanosensitive ion channel [Gemella sp. GH3]|uniref:mechanosensitive ion channel family protein n=1 Tax=unclassified Gemella TaxID=2624949 RepID=UPI0015CFF20A|nr:MULTISPECIES: mechanosensitive ion channel domain-containing protein [unclassified Gemella]MBF0714436.1 mechanosensitive ion channel [Gemella sp. GH3.1]NYS51388.1 mechanosensitive ion channel [Gemella sp. GH3]